MLDHAAVEADLPGILRAYGWQAVRGEDAQDQRVLTDTEGTRRIMVWRHPEDGRWQWWDTAVEVIGNIVDALRQLAGFQLLRDIIRILRFALSNPPGPLPVQIAEGQSMASNHVSALSATYHLTPSGEKYDPAAPLDVPDQTAVDVLSNKPAETDEKSVVEDAETTDDQSPATQESSDAGGLESSIAKLPKKGRGRR